MDVRNGKSALLFIIIVIVSIVHSEIRGVHWLWQLIGYTANHTKTTFSLFFFWWKNGNLLIIYKPARFAGQIL